VPSDQEKLRKRLNRPVVVAPFPADDHAERTDTAIEAWWHDIFEYFDVDLNRQDRWEVIAWCLARLAFPKFDIIDCAKGGAPKTENKADHLLAVFEAYRLGKKKATYKQFLRDHGPECEACGIKTNGALKDAIFRARRRRARRDLLRQFGLMQALGVNPYALIRPIQD
jgi:hypothetical protein